MTEGMEFSRAKARGKGVPRLSFSLFSKLVVYSYMSQIIKIVPLQKMPRDKGFFDYKVSGQIAKNITPGAVFEVPFGKRKLQSVFYRFETSSPFDKLRELEEVNVLGQLPDYQLKLIDWFSKYYYYSPASTLILMLPAIPKKKQSLSINQLLVSYKKINLTANTKKVANDIWTSPEKKYLILPNSQELKTKVYLQLVNKAIEENKQIVLLFPQVEKVKSFYQYLDPSSRKHTCVISSEVQRSKNRHHQLWQDISDKKYNVIVGTRSSVFAPLQNCHLMIVDESHSEDYKQWDQTPRYNVVKVIKEIQNNLNNKLILTSVTPRIEIVYEAKKLGYKYISLGEDAKVNLSVVDLSHERQKGFTYLTDKLIKSIDLQVKKEKQSLLIVNKRGLYSYLLCQDCSWTAKCLSCEMPLIINAENKLECRNCEKKGPVPLACPRCEGANLKPLGIGIEQISRTLKKEYGWTCSEDVESKTAQVILSTGQNITEGSWGNVGLLGFVYIDSLVYLADYNSNYKLYSFIKTIINSAGSNVNEIILQTCFVNNLAIEHIKLGYTKFYKDEIEARKAFNYPPFSNVIKIFFQHHDLDICEKEARHVYKELKQSVEKLGGRITEPYLYYLRKVRKRYRYQIAIVLPKISQKEEEDLLSAVPSHWMLDKDPKDLL